MSKEKDERKMESNYILNQLFSILDKAKIIMFVKDICNNIIFMNEAFKETFFNLDSDSIEKIKQNILRQVIPHEEPRYYRWWYCDIFDKKFCYMIVPQFSQDDNSKISEAVVMIDIRDLKNALPRYSMFIDKDNYLDVILECIDDGIFITDGEGNVIGSNSRALGSLNRESILYKNMKDLIDDGVYEDSIALKAIKEHKTVSMIQHIYGEDWLSTAIPYIRDQEVKMVVICGHRIDEMEKLKMQLLECKKRNSDYERELRCMRLSTTKDEGFVAETPEMRKVVELAHTAAKFELRALIEGETGVGKEVIAKLIYRNSPRYGKPFISVNCGAIPETLLESELYGYEKGAFTGANKEGKKGFFELANHGILFLDEIGEVSQSFQVKLLRAMEENEIMRIGGSKPISIDVQFIAATNKNLLQQVNEGEFRADLYYRLSSFPIYVPPLRERHRDIISLVNLFTLKFNKKYSMSKEFSLSALTLLQNYQWPGNVRELENIVERLMLISQENIITDANVTPLIFSSGLSEDKEGAANLSLKESVEMFEREMLLQYIKKYKKKEEIEEILKISRSTLNRKLKEYNIINYLSE